MSAAGKRVLVTGAGSGIGLATAQALARQGAELVLVGRDPTRAETAREAVARAATGPAPTLLLADLASQAAVRALAAEVARRFDRLDVLVNNAGALFARRETSVDGIEMTFATNHLAPFLLTLLLLDRLAAAPDGRVVTVSSRAQSAGLVESDLQGRRRYRPFKAYGQSKLLNVLFTVELARRARGRVTANCLSPGFVRTRFGQQAGGFLGLAVKALMATPLAISVEEGARTVVHLAASADVTGVTGRHFFKSRESPASPLAQDTALAARIWATSVALTGAPDLPAVPG